jgi:uncharacterized protein (DUF924 family)
MRNIRKEILDFWFVDSQPQQWFQVNETYDKQIEELFKPAYQMAVKGLCDGWMSDPQGCVALCLTLCQLPRHIFRHTGKAYDTDKQAVYIAKHAVFKKFDEIVPLEQRYFLYSPFMYSEHLADQRRSVELFSLIKDKEPVHYKNACERLRIIEEFGRFPARNAFLGRISTKEESYYLDKRSFSALS